MTLSGFDSIATDIQTTAGIAPAGRIPALAARHGTDQSQTLMHIFGQNVRALRERREWPPAQLAALIECTEAELVAIEAGEPANVDLDLIVKIKTVLNVTYRDLVGGLG